MSDTPIADLALLSDCNSAAIVNREGTVEWLAFPRFDSAPVMARLLDDHAGHWSVRPTSPAKATRRYLPRTMVLETTFTGEHGTLVLTDAMAMGAGSRGHDIGVDVPHALVRRLACTAGAVEVEVDFAPRLEYGLIHPLLAPVDGGIVARGGADVLTLSSPAELVPGDEGARAVIRLEAGQTAHLALVHRTASATTATVLSQEEIAAALDSTIEAWTSWSDLHQSYEGPWQDLVHRSGLVLQGLTYRPTGAICAAATTSLPEEVGGVRNWDYRYAWVRDASLTIEALWVAACPDEADEFFSFMAQAGAAQRPGSDLQIMFGIGGEHDLSERELPHLDGWRGSKPVRVGNGAWDQRQLDVYGELLSAVHRLPEQLDRVDAPTKAFFAALADTAADRWRETDEGIWEVRGGRRHFVYSKLMCWVALDRAVSLAERLGVDEERVAGWRAAGAEIREEILTRGWSETAQAFAQSYDADELDASNLMIPLVGFLPADDPRVLSTIDAIARDLTDDRGLVFRYRAADGLGGEEGTFLLCTFWLAQALARSGQPERAREVMERAVAYANDIGLLAEEVEPGTGDLLGNFPQAFSHIGLVNAAWAIHEAERQAADAPREKSAAGA